MTEARRAETNAHAAASYLVSESQLHGDPITNLKLQKLLYYAQGWFLALYDRPLFADPIRAWVRGPVVYEVWKNYSDFRWNPITARVRKPSISEVAQAHLNEILEVYGDYSAYTLERMTHQEEPWLRARGNLSNHEPSTTIISLEAMKAHFKKLADEPAA